MLAKFKLGEPLARAVGLRQTSLEVTTPASGAVTVGDALNALVAAYPGAIKELRLGTTESDFYYTLFVNDRLVLFANRDKTLLHQGDVISVFLPLAGG
jgi:molybdopterin converting factor small subunit